MNIISNNYINVLKNMIISKFNDNLIKEINKTDDNPTVFNYINLLSTLDKSLCNIAKESLVTIFETIDKGYRNSFDRKNKYHIKAHHTRSLMTIFGEITFERTFYSDKYNKGSFCYLDWFLGLKKYDYFDPYIKALTIDYSSKYSFQKTGNMISEMIGNRIELVRPTLLSRQTVRNIIIKSTLSIPECNQVIDTDTIYIMADEKFIHTQRNSKQDIMVKSIVVFDDIKKNGKRTKLLNKKIFSNNSSKIIDDVLDYIYKTYDTKLIKNVYYMGDGAGWIKSLKSEFKFEKNTNVIFGLDKFHFRQALHHICQDKLLEDNLTSYVTNDCKDSFNEVCNNLIVSYSHRAETIINKREYILNNWQFIINSYNYNLKCCMESNISHNIADLFTSRPKAYSTSMIDKLIEYRMLYKNNYNLKSLYLNNYNKKEQVFINKEHLNFDIFDKYKSNQFLSYNNYLFNPTF
jgi:hypothetical protein